MVFLLVVCLVSWFVNNMVGLLVERLVVWMVSLDGKFGWLVWMVSFKKDRK